MKVMEEAAKSVDDIKPVELLNKNIIDTNVAPLPIIRDQTDQNAEPLRIISI